MEEKFCYFQGQSLWPCFQVTLESGFQDLVLLTEGKVYLQKKQVFSIATRVDVSHVLSNFGPHNTPKVDTTLLIYMLKNWGLDKII